MLHIGANIIFRTTVRHFSAVAPFCSRGSTPPTVLMDPDVTSKNAIRYKNN